MKSTNPDYSSCTEVLIEYQQNHKEYRKAPDFNGFCFYHTFSGYNHCSRQISMNIKKYKENKKSTLYDILKMTAIKKSKFGEKIVCLPFLFLSTPSDIIPQNHITNSTPEYIHSLHFSNTPQPVSYPNLPTSRQ